MSPYLRLKNLFMEMRKIETTSILFNQYFSIDRVFDEVFGAEIRRINFFDFFLYCYDQSPMLFVGEAPSYCGCRFSGIPFTDERGIVEINSQFNLHLNRSSKLEVKPYKEMSAGIFWGSLKKLFPHFLLWNVIPFHPHKRGLPLTNRTPTKNEIQICLPYLKEFVDITKPHRIFAIGKIAERSLKQFGYDCIYLRHPGQGGATIFRKQVQELIFDSGLAEFVSKGIKMKTAMFEMFGS